ncbi:MAG: methyltransferase [Halobacteriovoraceae bacterium]|nr:methyltransferase [Halobacteriovoraceae bacterium]|tara:strand:+ start:15704 stop:16516 length:813 start_codon:yes stop_codon:yes gene_type:complete
MKKLNLLLASFLLFGCSHKYGHHKNHLKKIVKADHRSEKNITRNIYRHPVETLRFFEIKPHMKVAEISPGGGWYTEILGPYLKNKGELYLTLFSDNSKRSYAPKLNAKIKEMTQNKKLYGNVKFSTLETPDAIGTIAPANSLDRVVTFRNVHNWMKDGKVKEVFSEFYKALKPGGILGVVEHRAKSNKKQDPKAISGYVREDYIIELAEALGFEFMAKSEVNANYIDSTNHPEGVWTLPPSLRLKDKKRAYYLSIGESDRMTLKFRKPKN